MGDRDEQTMSRLELADYLKNRGGVAPGGTGGPGPALDCSR